MNRFDLRAKLLIAAAVGVVILDAFYPLGELRIVISAG